MRNVRQHIPPILVIIALVSLLLGPAAAAGNACTSVQADAVSAHACCPELAANYSCPAPEQQEMDHSACQTDSGGMAHSCGLVRAPEAPAAVQPTALRVRDLHLNNTLPAFVASAFLPQDALRDVHRLAATAALRPGSQHQTRPDAGRAPPAD